MIQKTLLFSFLLLGNFLHAFYDETLDKVWSSIVDIKNPTLEEYRLLEDYLNTKRLFLDFSVSSENEARLNQMRNFRIRVSIASFSLLTEKSKKSLFGC